MTKQDSTEARLAQLPERTAAQEMLYRYSAPIESLTEQQRDKDMQEAVRAARAAVRHQQEAYYS